MFELLIIIFGLPSLLLVIDFIKFVVTGRHLYNKLIIRILEFASMIALPISYFLLLDEKTNDCCSDSATFSPDHRLTIYVLIIISELFYFYSSFKKSIGSPIIEVFTNVILILGFALNIFISIQIGSFLWLFGNLPIGILFIYQLYRNHYLFLELNRQGHLYYCNHFEKIIIKILQSNPIIKFPVFLILTLPVLTVISSFLLLFGQKSDSLIRVFTDTYKHGFSQLDYLCDNVQCGGHFLCSVAANGHNGIVKPIRYGERNNCKIICNRQLLISNAFEELIEQSLPKTHKIIRRNYNKIGNVIHKHYHIFNNKFISDIIYVLMKPMELFFILTLYTFDTKPENRIARQYMSRYDMKLIKEKRLPTKNIVHLADSVNNEDDRN